MRTFLTDFIVAIVGFAGFFFLTLRQLPAQTFSSDSSRSRTEVIVDSILRNRHNVRPSDSLSRSIQCDSVPPWMLHGVLHPSRMFQQADNTGIHLLGLEERRTVPGYNRVDGVVIGIGATATVAIAESVPLWAAAGIAWGSASHYWQGYARVEGVLSGGEYRLGIEGVHITDTRQAWRMGEVESSLAAVIMAADPRDYYRRSGLLLDAAWHPPGEGLAVLLRYSNEVHRSMQTSAFWSIAGADTPSVNPAVREGALSSLMAAIKLVPAWHYSWNGNEPAERKIDYRLGLVVERGLMGGWFTYGLIDADLSWMAIGNILQLGLRARMGAGWGDIPPQRRFVLGGTGALPALPRNSLSGERSILVGIRTAVRPFATARSLFLSELTLHTRLQIGDAWDRHERPPSLYQLPGSLELSVGSPGGHIRIGVVKRTDQSERIMVIVRMGVDPLP